MNCIVCRNIFVCWIVCVGIFVSITYIIILQNNNSNNKKCEINGRMRLNAKHRDGLYRLLVITGGNLVVRTYFLARTVVLHANETKWEKCLRLQIIESPYNKQWNEQISTYHYFDPNTTSISNHHFLEIGITMVLPCNMRHHIIFCATLCTAIALEFFNLLLMKLNMALGRKFGRERNLAIWALYHNFTYKKQTKDKKGLEK